MPIHPALLDLYTNHTRKPKELWVSNLAPCPRYEFFHYKFRLAPKMSDAILSGIFLHRLVQEKLKEEGYEVEKRVEYDLGDGWKLVGRVDAVKDVVVEIKTTNDYTKDIPEHWVLQANFYAWVLGTDKYIILIIDKPTGHYQEVKFDVDEGKAMELVERGKVVKEGIVSKSIPDGRCDWCLKYCEFSVICERFR